MVGQDIQNIGNLSSENINFRLDYKINQKEVVDC
jgi:hypothetical protein